MLSPFVFVTFLFLGFRSASYPTQFARCVCAEDAWVQSLAKKGEKLFVINVINVLNKKTLSSP